MRDLLFLETKTRMKEFDDASTMDARLEILDDMMQRASLLQEVSDQLRSDVRAVQDMTEVAIGKMNCDVLMNEAGESGMLSDSR